MYNHRIETIQTGRPLRSLNPITPSKGAHTLPTLGLKTFRDVASSEGSSLPHTEKPISQGTSQNYAEVQIPRMSIEHQFPQKLIITKPESNSWTDLHATRPPFAII